MEREKQQNKNKEGGINPYVKSAIIGAVTGVTSPWVTPAVSGYSLLFTVPSSSTTKEEFGKMASAMAGWAVATALAVSLFGLPDGYQEAMDRAKATVEAGERPAATQQADRQPVSTGTPSMRFP